MTAVLGEAEIAALIPHARAMCLLDAVLSWDATSIVCRTASHREAPHPLASGGHVDPVCGIEYAAQAMAVHGGLIAGRRPNAGYLASVRDVTWHAGPLDLLPGDLEVTATLLAGDAAGAVYRFSLRCGEATILAGRAAVVIDAALPLGGEATT